MIFGMKKLILEILSLTLAAIPPGDAEKCQERCGSCRCSTKNLFWVISGRFFLRDADFLTFQ